MLAGKLVRCISVAKNAQILLYGIVVENGSKNNICLALLAFRDGGKVMLKRRADADIEAWEFIGGGVEVGETPFDAVRREIFEEVNYTLSPDDDLQFVGDYDFEYDETRAKVYFFTAKSPGIDKFSDSEEVA